MEVCHVVNRVWLVTRQPTTVLEKKGRVEFCETFLLCLNPLAEKREIEVFWHVPCYFGDDADICPSSALPLLAAARVYL